MCNWTEHIMDVQCNNLIMHTSLIFFGYRFPSQKFILYHFLSNLYLLVFSLFFSPIRFPSLESYMAAVIMGHLIIKFKSILFFPIALGIIFLVGISRLYTKSRFPHQIFGSWICGFFGLFVCIHFCEFLAFHR